MMEIDEQKWKLMKMVPLEVWGVQRYVLVLDWTIYTYIHVYTYIYNMFSFLELILIHVTYYDIYIYIFIFIDKYTRFRAFL